MNANATVQKENQPQSWGRSLPTLRSIHAFMQCESPPDGCGCRMKDHACAGNRLVMYVCADVHVALAMDKRQIRQQAGKRRWSITSANRVPHSIKGRKPDCCRHWGKSPSSASGCSPLFRQLLSGLNLPAPRAPVKASPVPWQARQGRIRQPQS